MYGTKEENIAPFETLELTKKKYCLFCYICGFFFFLGKYFLVLNPSFTSKSIKGTSKSGPITVANAAPEPIPYRVTATAMATSKWLLLPIMVVSMALSYFQPKK